MVIVMIAIGGLTRLTDSGLSMTDWKPITGWLPPLNESQWQEELQKYRSSPQYQQVNRGMNVHQFKTIFWLEYIHRLMGRIIGLVFFLPLAWFLFTRQIDKILRNRLLMVLSLGATQAVVGWLMVKSGLKDRPAVSQYWLAFHLSMATAIFCLLFTLFLSRLKRLMPKTLSPVSISPSSYRMLCVAIALILFQIVLGAFVAGLDAGLIYNTFPTMNGAWVPSDLYFKSPWYLNHTEHQDMVQFQHRITAYVVVLSVITTWWKLKQERLPAPLSSVNHLFLGIVAIQFLLGVFTLLHHVPTTLASLHQIGAFILLAGGLGLYSTLQPKLPEN